MFILYKDYGYYYLQQNSIHPFLLLDKAYFLWILDSRHTIGRVKF